MNKKRIYKCLNVFLILLGLIYFVSIPQKVCARTVDKVKVTAQSVDTNPIPDKYNTGCSGSLKKVSGNMTVSGIKVLEGSSDFVFNFIDANQDIKGKIYIDDYDFSSHKVSVSSETKISRDITLVFRNCKFSWISRLPYDSRLKMEFENCSVEQYWGSNATFTRCAIGGTSEDGMEIQRNVTVKDSFFSDFNKHNTKGVHTDGIHIFGNQDHPVTVSNILIQNCRFEIPMIKVSGDVGYINACFVLGMEFGDAENVKLTGNIFNGGGHSLYAGVKKEFDDGTYASHKVSNIVIDQNRIGTAKAYACAVNPYISNGVTITNMVGVDALYVGSVWKDETGIHLSVTNDTNKERILRIVTDNGVYEKKIPACPSGEKELKNYSTFASMPFDLVVTVPKDSGYVVCLDATESNLVKQIRFVNYTGADVYISKKLLGGSKNLNNPTLLTGKCGDNIQFSLSKDYVLTLTGSGAMYNYSPAASPAVRAPWGDYAGSIRQVVISGGITEIGSGAFYECMALSQVTIPGSVTNIHSMAFFGATSLRAISVASTVKADSTNVFEGTQVKPNVVYSQKK